VLCDERDGEVDHLEEALVVRQCRMRAAFTQLASQAGCRRVLRLGTFRGSVYAPHRYECDVIFLLPASPHERL